MSPNLHEVAMGYLLAHQAEHLSADRQHLIDRCARHLQAHHDCAAQRATVVTMQALGEMESRGNAAHVDISASTSFAIFLRDPASGATYVYTAADLLRIGRAQRGDTAHTIH